MLDLNSRPKFALSTLISENSAQTCENTFGEYLCSCAEGFEGEAAINTVANCTNVDECSANPCGSNQNCQDTHGGYLCICETGFAGETGQSQSTSCENIDECLTGPCGEHQTCSDTDGGFNCTCESGYTGTQGMDTENLFNPLVPDSLICVGSQIGALRLLGEIAQD